MSVSRRVQSIEPSPIRKIIDLAETRPHIIGLHAGEPDFPTPKHIVEAGSRALDDGYTHYTHGAGVIQLREAISRKLRQENGIEASPKTEITVTAGGFAAIFATIQATINPGDEVIVLQPFWPSYAGFVRLADGVPVPVSLRGPRFRTKPCGSQSVHHRENKDDPSQFAQQPHRRGILTKLPLGTSQDCSGAWPSRSHR